MPSSMSTSSWASISSSMRDAWRALRAMSVIPFLWLSNSSSVMIGMKMSCSSKRNRQLGSCISTLVSRTKILVTAGFFVAAGLRGMEWAFGQGGKDLKGFDEIEDFLDVAGYLDAPPCAAQNAAAVADEGAALEAPDLCAVHVFHFHDSKQVADGFIGIGAEFEREFLLGLEVFVRFQAVAGDAEDDGAGGGEFGMQVAEVLAFGGAAGRAVLGVEVDDDHLAGLGGGVEGRAAGRGQGEVGDWLVEHGDASVSCCLGHCGQFKLDWSSAAAGIC